MNYKYTMYACFAAYVVQAAVNNFVPLLFVHFQHTYNIPLSRITVLITVNFAVQLLVDMLSAGFVDRIGYRASSVTAHIFAAAGFILLALLPDMLPDPFIGLLISVVIYALGGGLIEVIVSPMIEACPTENKEKTMSLLHSFYCWGQVGVVLLSTIFFTVFGIDNWKLLSVTWAAVPAINAVIFLKVPIYSLRSEGERGLSLKELFSKKIFWLFMLLMMCAGACELTVSQWASAFAEQGLRVSKAAGDLAGPMMFAVLMGSARLIYGKFGAKIDLDRFMKLSCILCIASYLCISAVPVPAVNLIGCGVCGFSVGILWPGTFSKAAAAVKNGGTAMFALLALAGDLGCSAGPTLAGFVSGSFGGDLKTGIFAAVLFPVLMLTGLAVMKTENDNVR